MSELKFMFVPKKEGQKEEGVRNDWMDYGNMLSDVRTCHLISCQDDDCGDKFKGDTQVRMAMAAKKESASLIIAVAWGQGFMLASFNPKALRIGASTLEAIGYETKEVAPTFVKDMLQPTAKLG